MKIWKTVVLMLLIMCAGALAAEQSGSCGNNATWEYADGVLTISGTGDMYGYYFNDEAECYEAPWAEYSRSVVSVKVEDGITSLGTYAFYEMDKLTEVTIAGSVTSVGRGAFLRCVSLKKVTLPQGVVTIRRNAFEGCTGLRSVTIPESVTAIESAAFLNCTGLMSAVIPGGVTAIGDSAFRGCVSLRTVILREGVTSLGAHAFEGCVSLSRVDTPASLASVGYAAFSGCVSLTEGITMGSVSGKCGMYASWKLENGALTISGKRDMAWYDVRANDNPPWYEYRDTITSLTVCDGIESIGPCAFWGCTALTEVVIPDSVIVLDYNAFYGCSSLKTVTLPAGIDEIGSRAFYGCKNISDVYYSGDNTDRQKISISDGNTLLTGAKWHMFTGGSCAEGVSWKINADTELCISGTGAVPAYAKGKQPWAPGAYSVVTVREGVTELGAYAFYGTEISRIYIPASVKVFGENVVSCSPVVYCPEFSRADAWAAENGFETVYTDSDPGAEIIISGDAAIYRNETHRFTAAVVPAEQAGEITWTSSDTEVATVDGTGLAAARSAGTATITARCGNLTASAVLTVRGFADVGKLTIKGGCSSMITGETVKLIVTSEPADASLVYAWTSSDESVLTVSRDGSVTAVGTGTARVSVAAEGITAVTGDITVYDFGDTGEVLISGAPAFLGRGQSARLTAQTLPAELPLSFTWASSDESVITVSQDGEITAVGRGTARVTVSAGGVSAVTRDIVCDVFAESITLPEEMWCVAKIDAPVPCEIFPADAGVSLVWTAEHSDGISVTITEGVLYSIMPGDVTITVTDTVTGITARTTAHVCYPVTAVTLPAELTVTGETRQLECVCVTGGGNYGNELVTYTSDNDAVATITQGGLLTAVSEGTVNITATAIGGQSAVCAVTVSGGVKWTFENGALTISGKGDMESWNDAASVPWHEYTEEITSVTIKGGITSIGKSAFMDCANLATVTIPESVKAIGYSAFKNCVSLAEVSIPDGVAEIGFSVFRGCTGLKAVTIPDSVKAIGNYAFEGCGSLEAVTIPAGAASVGNYAFKNCKSLTEITIPDSVITLGGSAFQGCGSLKTAVIGSGVTSIGDNTFNGCGSLAAVAIPAGVTSVGNKAFNACGSLVTVYYGGKAADRENISLGSYNTALTDAEWVYTASGTCGENATWRLEGGALTISGTGDMDSWNDAASVPWYDYINDITSVTVNDGITSIGKSAFMGCANLVSVKIPESVKAIGYSAFKNCEGLAEVTIPDGVTDIGFSAFRGCANLETMILPDSVTAIGNYAFEGCAGLETITIPAGVTSIGNKAFYNCDSLTTVYYGGSRADRAALTLGTGNTALTDAAWKYTCGNIHYCEGSACVDCGQSFDLSGLYTLTLPEGVVAIGANAFSGTAAQAIIVPDGCESIAGGAFEGFTGYISLPAGLEGIALPADAVVIYRAD